ncbi:hypothetical protein ACFYZN_21835 [Streptomyces sp. NPDC001777]
MTERFRGPRPERREHRQRHERGAATGDDEGARTEIVDEERKGEAG